ncbi:hypothetical protein IGI04_042589 [Brassica rapa subsp. trilocularis]|uniref:Uncharacterized protein n=1 Tax=Brassica rapa subsp. trilocularis TaxID=1813537 RepID=A0ABQ7KLW9_BRACM|nr:hypothetical protein IGI04_042589 [Brassica rapa subsp. trilocularis]
MARRSYLRLSTLDLSMGRDKRGELDRLSLAGKEKSALALVEACCCFRLKEMELLQSGTTRREEKKERGNEWGWFSQMKTTLKRCGVWRNHEKEESLKGKAAEKDQTARETSGDCFSLEESILLEKIEDVYENKINLRRVYEVKKVISEAKQGREEFNNHVRKLQHLWVELQGLRSHVDGDATPEQEMVLKLLASMESSYGWLVEMVLRGEQLPEMEEICVLIRRAYEIMRDDERLTMSRSESSWKPTGSRSESFQKLTMSRSEGSWRLTGSRSEGFRKRRRCRMLSKAYINIGKGRKRVVGECSYSAYMGESVEDSGVLKEQEKGSGADDRITRKEWRVRESSNPTSEAERTTPLDHERGNGTESHEQVQNQDSGQHNQEVTQEVESGAQSSGDGQRESTGSDESGTQSSEGDGSNESGAQSKVTIVTRVTRMARRSYLRLSTLDLSMGRDKRGELDRLSLAGKEKSALALVEACEQSQPWD